MSGACVRRARLQAAEGMPMPTKQMSLLRSARAAAIVIISVALKAISSSFGRVFARRLRRLAGIFARRLRRLACGALPSRMHRESLRPLLEYVRLHPRQEAVAVAGNGVPRLVIGVVALVVAVRIGGMCAAGNASNRA